MNSGFSVAGMRRLLSLRRGSAIQRDVDDEIRFHLESRVADLVRDGHSIDDARAMAMAEFGDLPEARAELSSLDQLAEARQRRLDWRDAVGQDLRDAYRSLRRSPAFALTVIVTIAIGVGANASMFAIVDRLLFRPPPHVQNADLIGRVYFTQTFGSMGEVTQDNAGFEQYDAVRTAQSIDAAAGFFKIKTATGRGPEARQIQVAGVTASYFPLLGVTPQIGRFFSAEEDLPPRGADVIVISDGFWKSRFGGRAGALGQFLLVARGVIA